MSEAPKIHFGLQQIVFAANYPHLDQMAQEAIEGRPETIRSYGGIDRLPSQWRPDAKFWGLALGDKV